MIMPRSMPIPNFESMICPLTTTIAEKRSTLAHRWEFILKAFLRLVLFVFIFNFIFILHTQRIRARGVFFREHGDPLFFSCLSLPD